MSTSKCLECGGETVAIRVVEQDHKAHFPLKYAAIDAKKNFFGHYSLKGELAAELCSKCGRVAFRAVPNK